MSSFLTKYPVIAGGTDENTGPQLVIFVQSNAAANMADVLLRSFLFLNSIDPERLLSSEIRVDPRSEGSFFIYTHLFTLISLTEKWLPQFQQ